MVTPLKLGSRTVLLTRLRPRLWPDMPHARPDPVLAATVRALRDGKGVTREALAFSAGITTGSLAHIELGHTCPSWETFRRIAAALGLSIGQLATAIEEAEMRLAGSA